MALNTDCWASEGRGRWFLETNEMFANIADWFYVLLAPGMIAGWFAIIGLVSWGGGWYRLASVYRDEMSEMSDGHTFRMQSLSLRGWFGYNNCITIEATERGLKVAVWSMLRPGHAPLFLPYDEMSVRSRSMLGVPLQQVRMKQLPKITIDFRGKLVDEIRERLGDVWPEEVV